MTFSSMAAAGVMVLAIYYYVESEAGKALYAMFLGAAVVFGGYLATHGVGG